MHLLFSLKMCPALENIRKEATKNLKELALALIIPHARQRFEVQQTPQDVKLVIRSCGILPAPSPAPSTTQRHSAQRKRCYICPRSKDKKTIFICNECNNFVCEDQSRQMVVQPMPGVKVRPTDNGTIRKIIRKSHMTCCGIFYAFCNTFSAYFFICFYIFESS